MPRFLVKHWFLISVAVGLGVTLLMPSYMHWATDFWEPRSTVALSLFLVAWTMPADSLLTESRRPYAAIWAIVLSYGLVPVGAWLVGHLAPDPDVRIGLVLVCSVPCTLASAILWTRLAGGNEATALLAVTGTIVISWFATPLLLEWLTDEVNIDDGRISEIMFDLIRSLIIPMFIGQGLRLIPACARFADRHKVWLSALSQALVLAIILKAGVNVGDKIQNDFTPMIFLWSVFLAVGVHLAALAAGMISSGWLGFDRGRQIAVAFSASQKTLQVSLLLYDQYFRESHSFAVMPLLFYHVGQLMLDTIIAKRMIKSNVRLLR